VKARIRSIFKHVADGVDQIVILNSVEPHIDNAFFYATGLLDGLFEGCSAHLYPNGSCEVVTSALEEEAARKGGLDLHVFRNRDERRAHVRRLLRGHRRIGVNAAELTHKAFEELRTLAPRGARFVDVSEAVTRARIVKDAAEVDLIRKACDIASRSLEQVLPLIEAGRTEREIAAELVYRMQRNGATGPSFRTIVASGPNSAEPHYTAGPRKLRDGDFVVIDYGALYRMYRSDITRTVVVGRASREQRRMYAVVARAQRASIKTMKPGVAAKTVDRAARSVIDATKYKGRFIHSTGHGLGLAVHDGGRLGPDSGMRLRTGMVLTNEPGVYVPGFGGVRIEDDVLVTKDGPKVLSSVRRDLLEL
jgi:Xaa-Pro dipeptidase